MEDRHIVSLLQKRAESALSALEQKFGRQLYTIALNILGDPLDAQECVNDTYLALWNAIPPAEPDPLTAYACRVGRNTALTRLRNAGAQKRRSHYDLSLEELGQVLPGETLEEQLDARELGRAIDRFLDTLSRQNRVLFLRRYWFGDRIGELAKAQGLSENAVSIRLSRLRAQLKDYLSKEGFFL